MTGTHLRGTTGSPGTFGPVLAFALVPVVSFTSPGVGVWVSIGWIFQRVLTISWSIVGKAGLW